MSPWSLVIKEIRYRKAGFLIGLICVVVAIGSLVGAVTLLNAHEVRTEEILQEREKETRKEMRKLEDDYRRVMKEMGHNVMILDQDQSITQLRSKGYADTYMPEEYVYKLGKGHVNSLNHLLPVLQQRITWPEHDLDIILTGSPGQVPVLQKSRFLTADGEAYKNPIVDPFPEGSLRLGSAVAAELGVSSGDSVILMGEEFVVHEVQPHQGDSRDIMVWCGLEKAQKWLDKRDKINAIYALQCICALEEVNLMNEEIKGILPDVQVLEMSDMVIARAEARERAEKEAKRAIAAEIEGRRRMLAGLRNFARILVPVILIASGLWVFFLILGNVREREAEIGILRAIGVKESKIMAVFLSKAVIIGLIGGVFGYLGGVLVGGLWGGVALFSGDFVGMFNPILFAGALFIAVALCLVAGWGPALKAARSDPADVLRQD